MARANPSKKQEDLPEHVPQPFNIEDITWYECLQVLLNDYEPAKSIEDADTFWSTNEIATAVASHFGQPIEMIDAHTVYQCMLYLQYEYAARGNLHLEWLLKSKIMASLATLRKSE